MRHPPRCPPGARLSRRGARSPAADRGDGGKAGVGRLAESPVPGALLGQRLERVEAQLVEALALDHDPFVVPVGKHVADVTQPDEVARVGWTGPMDEPLGARGGVVHVNLDQRGESKVCSGRGCDLYPPQRPQAPEGGAQARLRPLLG